MDMQQLVWAAWRELSELDHVFGHYPTPPPLETLREVTEAASRAVSIDAWTSGQQQELPFPWD